MLQDTTTMNIDSSVINSSNIESSIIFVDISDDDEDDNYDDVICLDDLFEYQQPVTPEASDGHRQDGEDNDDHDDHDDHDVIIFQRTNKANIPRGEPTTIAIRGLSPKRSHRQSQYQREHIPQLPAFPPGMFPLPDMSTFRETIMVEDNTPVGQIDSSISNSSIIELVQIDSDDDSVVCLDDLDDDVLGRSQLSASKVPEDHPQQATVDNMSESIDQFVPPLTTQIVEVVEYPFAGQLTNRFIEDFQQDQSNQDDDAHLYDHTYVHGHAFSQAKRILRKRLSNKRRLSVETVEQREARLARGRANSRRRRSMSVDQQPREHKKRRSYSAI